ncbi:uncharacterized protein LOC129752533 [Uranotaenia lowii]|uniref:uncharacterized protein LOC129752533 n=1 Tax=Uranotaenia lowii TaxID=190385 RepID=UPI00247AE080|nr:uncharacterized protein LOC129752533 [Uranotaenia lowii]
MVVGYFFVPIWILILAITQFTFFATMSLETCKVMNRLVKSLIDKQNCSSTEKISCTLDTMRCKMLIIKSLLTDLGRLYGVLIVNTVLSGVSATGLELLELYHFIQEPDYSVEGIVYFVYTLTWIGFLLAEVLLCIRPFYLVQKEIVNLGLNLCSLNDIRLFEMSDRFAQQILVSYKNTVACGVVPLDMRISVAIVTTLFTFFVLMIQAKNTAERALLSN